MNNSIKITNGGLGEELHLHLRTAVTGSAIKLPIHEMAGVDELESSNAGVKVPCLNQLG